MQYGEHLKLIPPEICSIEDYETRARKHVSPDIWTYINSGSASDLTLYQNLVQFDQIKIWNRVLRQLTQGHTRINLLGHELKHPIILGPVAHQKLVHPLGEIATAQAADVTETLMVASTLASCTLKDIAHATQSHLWFQLYFQQTKENTLELVKKAEKSGYTALVITVDVPINGLRTAVQRSGFHIPAEAEAVNISSNHFEYLPYIQPNESEIFQGWMSLAPSWDDIEWLKNNTRLPIILKGILHPDDAVTAQNIGADGIIVSNHGGRALDTTPTSLEVLPTIRKRLGADYPVLMDGGIRRGGDVFKAIALGANAVLLGRPQLYGLAVAGALGVAHMLQLLIQEFEVTMALAGCGQVDAITHDCIAHNPSHSLF